MRKKTKKSEKKPINPDAQGLFFIALGFLGILSFFSFSYLDPRSNWLGYVGYVSALGTEYIFGLAAYLIPVYLIWLGLRLINKQKLSHPAYHQFYFAILMLSLCMLLNIFAERFPEQAARFDHRVVTETIVVYNPYPQTIVRYNLGGIPFYFLYADLPFANLMRILSPTGSTLIFASLGIVSFLLLTRIRIVSKFRQLMGLAKIISQWLAKRLEKKTVPLPKIPPRIYTGLPSTSHESIRPTINLPLGTEKPIKPSNPNSLKKTKSLSKKIL